MGELKRLEVPKKRKRTVPRGRARDHHWEWNDLHDRFDTLGARALSDAEVISLILGEGSPQDVADADLLLLDHQGLKALCTSAWPPPSPAPFLAARAHTRLRASVELGRRALAATDRRVRLLTPESIYDHVLPRLGAQRREQFLVLSLNGRNVLLDERRIVEGTLNACPVDPRDVFTPALVVGATAIVVAHNHPSGDPEPSTHDVALTRQLAAGAALLGMRFLDHLVVGDDGFTSLRQRGLLSDEDPSRGPADP